MREIEGERQVWWVKCRAIENGNKNPKVNITRLKVQVMRSRGKKKVDTSCCSGGLQLHWGGLGFISKVRQKQTFFSSSVKVCCSQ